MFELSQKAKDYITKESTKYEVKRTAIIPCLYKIQEEKGWVSNEAVSFLAKHIDLPEAWINEVRQFYTMINKKPVGKKHVQVCCNITCCMDGGRELATALEQEFNVKTGELSEDGKVTIDRVECLGSCGTGPMMQINDSYHESLTVEKAISIIKG